MSYLIVWSDAALERLTEQFDYIARRNPKAAKDVINDLFERTSMLAEHPQTGQVFAGSAEGQFREMIFGKYRVIYRLDESKQQVSIVVVQHVRERPLHLNEVQDVDESEGNPRR